MSLIVADKDGMLRLDRDQRDVLVERGMIYYCKDHSTPENIVYHPEKDKDWFDISRVLTEQSMEKDE